MDNDNHLLEVQDYANEYNEIVRSSEDSVIVDLQWIKDGDYFEKLTMYDESYVTVPTLEQTTLINNY